MKATTPIQTLPIPGRWCLHSYYTLCPYAPDGSGRILAAGADLDQGIGEVLVLSGAGELLDRFGAHPLEAGFYHTGWWQSWSPDARFVYYQAGSLKEPAIAKRELATGAEETIHGDMEGAPPFGEPIVSGLLGMLYAAGYGDHRFKPEQAPAPFRARNRHGLFEFAFNPGVRRLRLSIEEILDRHPHRDRIRASDRETEERLGPGEGLTLMAYCVRWSPDGSRFLFYFGNHCVVRERNEPRLSYVFTAKRDLSDLRLALDLSYGRSGVHWGWQPDSMHLIGYGPRPDSPGKCSLAEVRYDGSGYKTLNGHASGGHPSVSPADPDLIVTDEGTAAGGAVVFFSRRTGREVARVPLPKFLGEREAPGRNARRVCHHPVFNQTGDKVLCNTLPGAHAALVEIAVPGVLS